jgi:hypothetical protein
LDAVDNWTRKVAENILPLSIATALPEAFREWKFTGGYEDHQTPDETCELCEHEDLRYQFEIENENNGNTLWVGSVCIHRFDIAVYEDGRRLSKQESKRHLDQLTKKMQLESCIRALEKLVAKEPNEILSNALEFYKRNNYLTPKYAFVVAWRLKERAIDHHPSFFKVALKRDQHKEDLSKMSSYKVHMLWPYLSPSQRKMAQRMGFGAPD